MRGRILQLTARLSMRFRRGRGGSSDAILSLLPDEALVPLRRRGLDPVPEMGRSRREPVSLLKLPFGIRGWLVTGYEESKAVLGADVARSSNDFGHLVGKVGITAEQDPGGLGFADPPAHTRLRHMLTPEFTRGHWRPPGTAHRRDRRRRARSLARHGAGGGGSTCGSTSRCPSRHGRSWNCSACP